MTLISIPTGIATSFTTPLGVYLGGNVLEGNGSYGWTLLGHLAGMAVGFTGGYLLREPLQSSQPGIAPTVPILFIATVLQLTGAIVAYELSTKRSDVDKRKSLAIHGKA